MTDAKPKHTTKENLLDGLLIVALIAATAALLYVLVLGVVGVSNVHTVTTSQSTTVVAAYTQPACALWCSGTEYHLVVENTSAGLGPTDISTNGAIYYTMPVGSEYVIKTRTLVGDPFIPFELIFGGAGLYVMGRLWGAVFMEGLP